MATTNSTKKIGVMTKIAGDGNNEYNAILPDAAADLGAVTTALSLNVGGIDVEIDGTHYWLLLVHRD